MIFKIMAFAISKSNLAEYYRPYPDHRWTQSRPRDSRRSLALAASVKVQSICRSQYAQ